MVLRLWSGERYATTKMTAIDGRTTSYRFGKERITPHASLKSASHVHTATQLHHPTAPPLSLRPSLADVVRNPLQRHR